MARHSGNSRSQQSVKTLRARNVSDTERPPPFPPGDAHLEIMWRIQRALAGYISYLAACDMNQSFSEYLLYEPILRVFTAQHCTVECEFLCPGYDDRPRTGGDKKRIDFNVTTPLSPFAIEVKWAKDVRIYVPEDRTKLRKYHANDPASRSFLCVLVDTIISRN